MKTLSQHITESFKDRVKSSIFHKEINIDTLKPAEAERLTSFTFSRI